MSCSIVENKGHEGRGKPVSIMMLMQQFCLRSTLYKYKYCTSLMIPHNLKAAHGTHFRMQDAVCCAARKSAWNVFDVIVVTIGPRFQPLMTAK